METVEGRKEIARVYIVEIAYSADKLYDYYIPTELEEYVSEGVLVSVPFGASNRRMNAVVWELSSKSDFDKVKPVSSVLSFEPLLDERQRSLCEFLKRHTLCTVGEAVKSAVPTAALAKISETVEAIEVGDDLSSYRLSEKSLEILSYIKNNSAVSTSNLRKTFGKEVSKYLLPLVKNSLVRRRNEISDASKGKFELFVSLRREADLSALRGDMQKSIVKVLSECDETSFADLSLETGCKKVQIATLEKKGIVTTEYREAFRNPYRIVPQKNEETVLSEEQSEAFEKLEMLYKSSGPKAALLFGVTGSGKTSVIKKMIDRVREDGKGVIMLVPEIALTPQAVSVFCGYYGESVSVLHSGLSNGERLDAWKRIKEGLSDIVIGTRSAILAPLKNIGLIIIDEEQEHTYKSDFNPKYSAHDVASFRCKEENAMMLLASATPSLSTYYKAVSGKYSLVELTKRYGGAVLPTVKLCDMRRESSAGNVSPLALELISMLGETVEAGKQAIVFLNRRGYNSTVACMSCGESVKCPNCSVSMTYHVVRAFGTGDETSESQKRRDSGYLICHYCGYKEKVPEKCPNCGKENFKYSGCGTQMVEAEIKRLIPKAAVSRMDTDTTSGKFSHREIIETFRSGKTNVLLGTQMVTKGHDFPKVTLVGVLGADSSLYLDDYRAAERTFSMLTQVIGRAGRKGGEKGVAVIQTLCPDSDVMRYAAVQDYKSFYSKEIRFRKNLVFPPFCDLAVFTLSSSDESLLSASATKLTELFKNLLSDKYNDIKLQAFGPFENPVYKVRNVCRMRLVVKCKLTKRFREMSSEILMEYGKQASKTAALSVDFNPASL